MVLSEKRITKALIRLRGCESWSAPVLFANPQRQDRKPKIHPNHNHMHIFRPRQKHMQSLKLEELKILKRSSDILSQYLNNAKLGQGQPKPII